MARTIRTAPPGGPSGADRNRIAQLREVLGVDQRRAQRLLDDAGGDFDAAVGLHFAGGDGAGPSSGGRAPPREAELRRAVAGMGLPPLTPSQAKRLLVKVGNSVEAAVELLLSDPSAAGAATPAEAQAEEVVLLDSSSDEDAGDADEEREEEEGEAEEESDGAAVQDDRPPPRTSSYMMPHEDEPSDSLDDSFVNGSSGFDDASDSDGGGGGDGDDPLEAGAESYDDFFNLTGE